METRIRNGFFSGRVLLVALSLITGIIAGFLAGYFIAGGTDDGQFARDELNGTFYDTRSYSDMKLADNFLFEGISGKAGFTVRYSPRITEARITVNSDYPLKIVAEFDQGNFGVMGVQTFTVSDESRIFSGGNYVQIENTGDNQYAFQLYNRNTLPNPVTFKVLSNDMQVYQYGVTINRE